MTGWDPRLVRPTGQDSVITTLMEGKKGVKHSRRVTPMRFASRPQGRRVGLTQGRKLTIVKARVGEWAWSRDGGAHGRASPVRG